MSKHTQPNESTAVFSTEEIRAKHPWFDLSVAELRRAFARSGFRGYVTFTKDRARVPQGVGAWKWDTFTELKIPYVSLTILDEPDTARHGVLTQAQALAHMLVHVEAGTQCISAEPEEWDDAEREIEFEAMRRMNWAPFCCDKWDDALQDFVRYDPTGMRDA